MSLLAVLLALASSAATADGAKLPADVESFIADRELCEHFRGEPFEGDSPEQINRREFIRESIEIHCSGTDRRLAALKKRYTGDQAVLGRLAGYEISSEADCQAGGL